MRDVIAKITDFHRKYGFGVGNRLVGRPIPQSESMRMCARAMRAMSVSLRDSTTDRCKRAGWVIEETGELVEALADGDETKVLDALADLIYVVGGTAVAFGLPLPEAFVEVHGSNMSKTRSDSGFRDKGPDYSPPDIAGVIERSRQ